ALHLVVLDRSAAHSLRRCAHRTKRIDFQTQSFQGRISMLTKALVAIAMTGALWVAGGAAYQNFDCCSPGSDCCNPPHECCVLATKAKTGDCCGSGSDCCFPPRECCVLATKAKASDCCAGGSDCCSPPHDCCFAAKSK